MGGGLSILTQSIFAFIVASDDTTETEGHLGTESDPETSAEEGSSCSL